ncbi:MAG: site-specific integrase [Clostridia bacterium]|nr:site-specific integrase [Clostridia bacterium]
MKANTGKREQQRILDEIRLEYSDIISIEALEIRFCDFIKKWNEETKAEKSITTYDGYCHMIAKYVYPYFKEKGFKLAELRPLDIEAYYRYLQRDCGLSGNTALKHHQIIYTSLKYAVYNRILKENPAETAKRPKKAKAEHDFYNGDELKELMTAAKNDPLETVIYLTVWLGLRREEVLGLKWANINFAEHTIKICETVVRAKQDGKITSLSKAQTKTEKSNRILYMSQAIEDYLHHVKHEQMKQQVLCGNCYNFNDYVCVDKMGEPIKPDYVTHRFSKVLKNNGLRHIKFHDLRHSTASYMLANGYNLKQVQELLGHSNYNFTADTYTHVDSKAKQAMADTISNDLQVCL